MSNTYNFQHSSSETTTKSSVFVSESGISLMKTSDIETMSRVFIAKSSDIKAMFADSLTISSEIETKSDDCTLVSSNSLFHFDSIQKDQSECGCFVVAGHQTRTIQTRKENTKQNAEQNAELMFGYYNPTFGRIIQKT